MVESTPTISYTQTTPNYSPIYQPILMSTDNNKINLISVLDPQPNNDDDDEAVPLPKIAEQDDKAPSLADKEAKYKIEDHPPSVKEKFSLWNMILSKRCSIKGSKLNMFLSTFMLILMLLNVAILVLFGLYFFRRQNKVLISTDGALSYMVSSLSADPILDITAGPACSAGYDSLLLGVWPGTTPGCECAAYLRSGVCRKTGKNTDEISCKDISSINPINLYDWDNSEWCVLKAKPGSQYKKAIECETGFRKCSSGTCVLDTLDCPVTKVELTGGVISTENVVGESPVIGFAVTPNDIPCFSDDRFPSGPVASYVLIDQDEDGCGRYGLDDQYSFVLAQQKQEEMFKENDFPKRVYSLPDYAPIYKKTDSVLSYRRRLNIAEKDICLNMDIGMLERPQSVTKDLKRFVLGTLVAAFLIHGILSFLIILMVLIETCILKSLRKVLQGDNEIMIWNIMYLVLTIAEYINFVVMLVATVHYRAKMIEIKDYLVGLADAGCFLDLQAQAAISDFEMVVDVVIGNFLKYAVSVFLIGSFALFSCVYLLWKLR